MSHHSDNRIRQLERASFERYCSLNGYTPEQVETIMMPGIRRVVEQRFVLIEAQAGKAVAQDLRSKWASALHGNYLDLHRFIIELEKAQYASVIAESARDLPINYSYLRGLAQRIDASALRPSDSRSLKLFLNQIPTINLFEPDFNAFVSGETVVDSLPAVCVYAHLHDSLQEFVDMVAPVVLVYGGVATPDDVAKHASKFLFRTTCIECLELICGRLNMPATNVEPNVERLSKSSQDGVMYLDLITGGGWSFVWFHEYGHLLMAHLAQGPCHDVELEADAFAARALSSMFAQLNANAFGWVSVGVVFTFVAIHIIEVVNRLSASSSHPPAHVRLGRYVGNNIFLRLVAESIVAACQPAVERRWNITIRL